MKVQVIENVLKLNDDVARTNREAIKGMGIFAIDILGGPGCGKTTLVEQTVAALGKEIKIAVIVGDLATARDADRISKFASQVVQINTGKGCHLEAHQIRQAMERMDLKGVNLLIIENVGNLVCPVGFDLGQDAKVGVFCTTEGSDKPAKYPYVVTTCDVLLLNKADLLAVVPFDLEQFEADIRHLKPEAKLIRCSAYKKDIGEWLGWLRGRMGRK